VRTDLIEKIYAPLDPRYKLLGRLAGVAMVDLEEAARIDGASRSQTFRYVILPLLRPTLVLVLVFSVAGSLGVQARSLQPDALGSATHLPSPSE